MTWFQLLIKWRGKRLFCWSSNSERMDIWKVNRICSSGERQLQISRDGSHSRCKVPLSALRLTLCYSIWLWQGKLWQLTRNMCSDIVLAVEKYLAMATRLVAVMMALAMMIWWWQWHSLLWVFQETFIIRVWTPQPGAVRKICWIIDHSNIFYAVLI